MIKTESLSKLLVKLKIAADEAAAKELITGKDEKDVAIPDGLHFFTQQELETRENTLKANQIKAGKEIAIKELKEKVGLTYDGEGSKDPEKFVTEYSKKVLGDANISTDEKIKDRDKTIEKLRKNVQDAESALNNYKGEVKSAQLDSELLMWTAELKPENLTNKEWVNILKMSNEFTEEEGKLVVKRDGEIVKDAKTLVTIPAKDALIGWINDRKLGKQVTSQGPNGRGAGDSKFPVGGIRNLKQFNEHIKSLNIDEKSTQAAAMLQKLTAEVPDFDLTP